MRESTGTSCVAARCSIASSRGSAISASFFSGVSRSTLSGTIAMYHHRHCVRGSDRVLGLYSRHHVVGTAPEEEFELIKEAEVEPA
jgi:hypothetical protein